MHYTGKLVYELTTKPTKRIMLKLDHTDHNNYQHLRKDSFTTSRKQTKNIDNKLTANTHTPTRILYVTSD